MQAGNSDNTEKAPITIAISGAAGTIGYGLLFRIAAGAMFGANQSISLRLLEEPQQMRQLRAMEMELVDCAYPLLHSHLITDDPLEAFAGADWIILLAASLRGNPYPPRMELLKRNGEIYVEHGRAINKASPAARILVVTSPCNPNCMVAMAHAQDVPKEHWFALNRLDAMRGTALIAQKAGVPVGQVNRVTVWGNHSELQYVDFHNSFINDTPAHELIHDVEWSHETLQAAVATRSKEVFDLRGRSPTATTAQAILSTVWSISNPTPFGRRFAAAVCSDGSYGVPRGLVFGFPLRTEDGRHWSIVPDLYLDEFAQTKIQANIAELEQEAVLAQQWFG